MPSPFKAVLAGILIVLSVSACVVAPARPRRPPPLVEVAPAMPAPGYHWVRGDYRWRGGQWVWMPGYWRVY